MGLRLTVFCLTVMLAVLAISLSGHKRKIFGGVPGLCDTPPKPVVDWALELNGQSKMRSSVNLCAQRVGADKRLVADMSVPVFRLSCGRLGGGDGNGST
jgi:hypothetical protein